VSADKPFRFGDVCKYVGDDDWSERHIIESMSPDGPEHWEYSTSQGAWIPHSDLELVAESSAESRAELHRLNQEELGEEDDEEEEV
jgi:hypothetical protein